MSVANETEINNRLDRLEQHIKIMQQGQAETNKQLGHIVQGLNGNDMGAVGLVVRVKDHEKRIDDLEVHDSETQIYIKQSKFVIGAVVVALIGIIIKQII